MNSAWLITSELANQRARKVLFTCVVYTNRGYMKYIPLRSALVLRKCICGHTCGLCLGDCLDSYLRLQQQSCVAEEMGTSQLWVIDRDGRVFLFNLRDKSWREISTPKLGSRNCFKRISAVEQCAWAISASQQPYLFVHATELPIRVKVETYENQRWGPVGGWTHTEKSVTTFAFVILIIISNNQLPTLVPLRGKT